MTRAAAIAAYLAALLAVDTQVSLHGQLVLGALTWAALVVAARPLQRERRAQVAVVICAATVAELTGSILWGVYTYRLHNLPTFVPPAHGLVFIAGLALGDALRRHARALVAVAAAAATAWGILGLTALPRTDAAGALGVPLLLAFLWRSRARSAYAGVFLVVAALELYGTAIGTWRWAEALPGLGIPDGNPPSGVASGYVWFDVIALLLAPRLLALHARATGSPWREGRRTWTAARHDPPTTQDPSVAASPHSPVWGKEGPDPRTAARSRTSLLLRRPGRARSGGSSRPARSAGARRGPSPDAA